VVVCLISLAMNADRLLLISLIVEAVEVASVGGVDTVAGILRWLAAVSCWTCSVSVVACAMRAAIWLSFSVSFVAL